MSLDLVNKVNPKWWKGTRLLSLTKCPVMNKTLSFDGKNVKPLMKPSSSWKPTWTQWLDFIMPTNFKTKQISKILQVILRELISLGADLIYFTFLATKLKLFSMRAVNQLQWGVIMIIWYGLNIGLRFV